MIDSMLLNSMKIILERINAHDAKAILILLYELAVDNSYIELLVLVNSLFFQLKEKIHE